LVAVTITRKNHYVPIWYQKRFLEPDVPELAYLDLAPELHRLPDGTTRPGRSRFNSPPTRCFFQRDLYTTFFGDVLNDEIERRLFGILDTEGAPAIAAFAGEDSAEWHEHFGALFGFMDAQKLRTPKGLDWLRSRYPRLPQNELMMEMQGLRQIHCTIWTEGVREVVSATDSNVKFIISDHPVTVYNYAMPPGAEGCTYPQDPSIGMKATQTIYPLDRDHCLILTNLEYAKDQTVAPLAKRIFARNYRTSMVRTDAFIRTRHLHADEVRRINGIIRARARRFVAAGRPEWLEPGFGSDADWPSLAEVLRPPEDELYRFGGEIFARFDDGHVHYQDAFGRTEADTSYLSKAVPAVTRDRDACGCGSDLSFAACCKAIPVHLRPSWTELGVRERNMILLRGITDILELDRGLDWVEVRQGITDERIRDVHGLYRVLWPVETDILQLLPKPDGRPRAVYSGMLHPAAILEFAFGLPLYFGEVIIVSPFVHAAYMRPDYSPIDSPRAHHQDFIKNLVTFLHLMPLVEAGFVHLIPDPTAFDEHLRDQMMHMAQARSEGLRVSPDDDPRVKRLMKLDIERGIRALPREILAGQLRQASPGLPDERVDETLGYIESLQRSDPLAPVRRDLLAGEGAVGQFSMVRLLPNFEMSLYLAQATGACIVTDSPHRWREILSAVARRGKGPPTLPGFAAELGRTPLRFVNDLRAFIEASRDRAFQRYPALFGDVLRYLGRIEVKGRRPNWESQLPGRLAAINREAQGRLQRTAPDAARGRLHPIFPAGGIQDNTVSRLLLMSSSEHHLESIPMAFYLERVD
jgi:hypothetical protein